jgi:hypothetical protein
MPEEAPRKIPRWFTCLVKGPLGCAAYLFGALIVTVLFLPASAGRLADRGLEGWFERRFEGTLELGEVWLGSFYNRQRIESLIVRDPSGTEVLRGSWRAPPLGALLAKEGEPIELVLSNVQLVEHADGSTNLERAFRAREVSGIGDVSIELPRRMPVVVRVERLRWSDAAGGGGLLTDLVWRGTLEARARRTALALEGGSDPSLERALGLTLDYQSPRTFGDGSWEGRCTLTAREVPLGLVRHIAAAVLPEALFDGETLDELTLVRDGEHGAWSLRDADFELEARGLVTTELLRGETGAPASLRVPLGSATGEALLTRCAPFLVPAVLSGEAPVEFLLEDFVLPRDGGWGQLEGRLRFRLPAGAFALDPSARAELGAELELAPLDLVAALPIVQGRVQLDGLALPLEHGMLFYRGTSALAESQTEVSFTHSLDGVDTPLKSWRGRTGGWVPVAPPPPIPGQDSR